MTEAMCLGQMLMHPWELDLYTFKELLLKLRGFADLKKEQLMQTRILAYCASSMTHPKYFSLEKFWPLDDKDRKNGEVPTMEEALALQQRFIDEGILSPTKRN